MSSPTSTIPSTGQPEPTTTPTTTSETTPATPPPALTSPAPPPSGTPSAANSTTASTMVPPMVFSTSSTIDTNSSTSSAQATSNSVASAQRKSNYGELVGVLFGGLIVGALVVIAILFYLRSRRRRTRNLFAMKDVMTDPSAPLWGEEKRLLLVQLNDMQAERAQLRTYLQLSDTQDPRDVVELFDKLNVSIRNSCLLASGAVLKSIQLRSSWTTTDARNLTQLQKDLGGVGELVLSARGAGRRPEEFLPQAFRYIVNLALMNNLFGLFHPGVSEDENKLLLDMYRDVCRRDPQRLSARWRCLTYSAIDSRIPPSDDWSNHFADDVLKGLSSIVLSLLGDIPSGVFPAKFRGELASIGAEAYKWNRSVKSTFKALDFRPVLFTSADPFDPASMTLYLSHKPEKLPPRNIIVAVTLALMSTSSVSSGEEIREEYVWQTKAEVLTEGFF